MYFQQVSVGVVRDGNQIDGLPLAMYRLSLDLTGLMTLFLFVDVRIIPPALSNNLHYSAQMRYVNKIWPKRLSMHVFLLQQ